MAPPVEGQAWREGLSFTDQSWVDAALEGMPVMTDRDPLLQERQKTHGSFADNARYSQQIKDVYREALKIRTMDVAQLEAIDMIALKLSRILSGQANFKDHWDDIAGYAKLGSEACE